MDFSAFFWCVFRGFVYGFEVVFAMGLSAVGG